jgi:hypothetical protein
MVHEHQRSDRDTYIKVQYENINDFEEVSRILSIRGNMNNP